MRTIVLALFAAIACAQVSWASQLPDTFPAGMQVMLTVTQATSATEKKGFRCMLDSDGQLRLSSVLHDGMGQRSTVVATRRCEADLVARSYALARAAITSFRLDPKETDESREGMFGVGIILLLGRQSISVADHAIADLDSRPAFKALIKLITGSNPELKDWPEKPQPEN